MYIYIYITYAFPNEVAKNTILNVMPGILQKACHFGLPVACRCSRA